jgi:hypothetical protein
MTFTPVHKPAGTPDGGQFAKRTALEPGIILEGPPGREQAVFVTDSHQYLRELEVLAGRADIEEITPATKAETKKLLKNAKGAPDGKVLLVRINHTNAPDSKPGEKIEIHGPKDGRPIIVDVFSGIPSLKVMSGTALIRPRSNWGNSVDVGPGAEAVLVAPADAKVTTSVDEGGKATFVCPVGKNRFRPFGNGEIYLSTGTDTDRVPYERPVYDWS